MINNIKQWKYWWIIVTICVLFVVGSFWFSCNKSRSLEEATRQNDSLSIENNIIKRDMGLIKDTLKDVAAQQAALLDTRHELENKISQQKTDYVLIKRKYDKMLRNNDVISVNSSIDVLSGNITREDSIIARESNSPE